MALASGSVVPTLGCGGARGRSGRATRWAPWRPWRRGDARQKARRAAPATPWHTAKAAKAAKPAKPAHRIPRTAAAVLGRHTLLIPRPTPPRRGPRRSGCATASSPPSPAAHLLGPRRATPRVPSVEVSANRLCGSSPLFRQREGFPSFLALLAWPRQEDQNRRQERFAGPQPRVGQKAGAPAPATDSPALAPLAG